MSAGFLLKALLKIQ